MSDMTEVHVRPEDASEGAKLIVPVNTHATAVNIRIEDKHLELFRIEIVVVTPAKERVVSTETVDREGRRFAIPGGAQAGELVWVRFPDGLGVHVVVGLSRHSVPPR